MAKSRTSYRCSECGWTTVRWMGRCGECGAWSTLDEVSAPTTATARVQPPTTSAVPISDVSVEQAARELTGIGELDRVLGGGLVPGAVVLLAGEPGVGKSTLLLAVAAAWARSGRRTLYVSGEESAAQVRLRAERTGGVHEGLWLAAEDDLATVLGHVDEVSPSLLVVDSVQTVHTSEADGSTGGVAQVREVTAALVRAAKQRQMAVVIVGHVTKEGSIAGPRTLEHLVDVVVNFEGDKHTGFRMIRATKNRFGPADEVGCFEMVEGGIAEVPDPSGLFLSQLMEPVPGTAVTVTMEGRRPLLGEIQALTDLSALQNPRRVTSGVDSSRVAMILAVLQRRAKVNVGNQDVYVSTVGGATIRDPAADLAIALALASACRDTPRDYRVITLGEIGLAGELRAVPGLSRRLAEAGRLGFTRAIVPARGELTVPAGVRVARVETVTDALQANDSVR